MTLRGVSSRQFAPNGCKSIGFEVTKIHNQLAEHLIVAKPIMSVDGSNYFDINDILSTQQRLPCKVEMPIYRLGKSCQTQLNNVLLFLFVHFKLTDKDHFQLFSLAKSI